jgi:hypothetical protein
MNAQQLQKINKRISVVGGGLMGRCNAYLLAAGHRTNILKPELASAALMRKLQALAEPPPWSGWLSACGPLAFSSIKPGPKR